MGVRMRLNVAILIGLLATALRPAQAAEDLLAQARGLAANKHRQEALDLLAAHLSESPNDVDARLLYGLVLSWEWRWDEARVALRQVLTQTPRYADAALALTNVELWSGHPDAAELVTSRFLESSPEDTGVILARARVFRALKQPAEALRMLKAVLQIDPHNAEAADMRRALREEDAVWDSGVSFNSISFSDHSSPWLEQSVSMRRGLSAGSLIFRFSRAYRFGYKSELAEVDWYPHLRANTYAYLNAGYSPNGSLYPTFRAGAELFHNLGRGYEASAGMRRLQFSSTNINVFTGSVGRYHKDWYLSARTFVTPGDPKASVSMQLQVRRYFGDGEKYISVRFGRGAAPFEIRSSNEVGVLDSVSFASEVYWRWGKHFLFSASGGFAGEDRVDRARLRQIFSSVSLKYRL